MKKFKNFIRIISIISVMIAITFLVGCDNKNLKVIVYGGDIIKNNTIMTTEKYLSYELPIIINCEVETFEIDEYKIVGKGDYDIEFENLTGGEDYNGWYYYFANLNIKVNHDVEADFSINSVSMNINNQNVEYEIPNLHFSNTIASFGGDCNTEKRDFVYNCEKTFLYQHIPSETMQTITLDIQNNCTITEFEILDFVSIENLSVKVNGKEEELASGISVEKGDLVTFDYTLRYKDNVSDMNLLKTTSYITYIDENKKKCAFVDEQGLMIINYQNDNFIKRYIDEKIEVNK